MRNPEENAGIAPVTTGDQPEATTLHPATEAHIVAIVEGYMEGLHSHFATKDELETALIPLWSWANRQAESSALIARSVSDTMEHLAQAQGKED